jgi:hypothetical protein
VDKRALPPWVFKKLLHILYIIKRPGFTMAWLRNENERYLKVANKCPCSNGAQRYTVQERGATNDEQR